MKNSCDSSWSQPIKITLAVIFIVGFTRWAIEVLELLKQIVQNTS